MQDNRQILHEEFPRTNERNKVICFLYLYNFRKEHVKLLLHKKHDKELNFVIMPTKLSEAVFGKDYKKYIQRLQDIGILKQLNVGINKYGLQNSAFKPLKRYIRYTAADKKLRDKAEAIHDRYLRSRKNRDWVVLRLEDTLRRTTYKGEPVKDLATKDYFAGRYYTKATTLSQDERLKHLRIDGEELAEADVGQCQMHILKSILKMRGQGKDFVAFMESGKDIYEFMKNELFLSDRKEAKKYVFGMLFGHPDSKASQALYYMFPDLEKPIREIKSIKQDRNKSDKIYSNLAWELQKYEVKILKRLANRFQINGIDFLSVHDSVLIKRSDSVRAMFLFQEVLDEMLMGAVVGMKNPEDVALAQKRCPLDVLQSSQ